MARKRLNVPFLIISGLVLLFLGVGAVGGYWYMTRRNPQPFIDRGRALAKEGNYFEAAEQLRSGLRYSRKPNPALWVEFGDVVNRLAVQDHEMAGQAVGAWNHSVEIDPAFQPGLERLLEHYRYVASSGGPGDRFSKVRQIADRLLAIDPNHTAARLARAQAAVMAAQAEIETDPAQLDQAMETLAKLRGEDPANADYPYFLAQASLARAQAAARQRDAASAEANVAQARQVMEEALKGQEDNAPMNLRAAQVGMQTLRGDAKALQAGFDRVIQQLEKARQLSKPGDELLTEIYLVSGRIHERFRNDLAGAEKIYRELLEKKPDDIQARLELADLLRRNPARRAEAITLLEKPTQPDPNLGGFKAIGQFVNGEILRLSQLANLKLDALAGGSTTADQAEIDKRLAEVSDLAGKIDTLTRGESPQQLIIRGRLALAKDQRVEGIQTLNRALTLMEPQGRGMDDRRADLMILLSQAYREAGQTGEAKNLLGQVVAMNESNVMARINLIELLLTERSIEEARRHVDFLEKRLPNPPPALAAALAKMLIATADPQKEQARIEGAYGKLPEGSAAERLDKARTAAAINKRDEAIRLAEAVRAEKPGDPQAAQLLAQLYVAAGQKDKAVAVVDEAVAEHPDNNALKLLQAQVKGGSRQDIQEVIGDIAAGITDPFTRELALFEQARAAGDAEGAVKHLFAAEQLKPDDTRVLELVFSYFLNEKNWEKANGYLDRLSKLNADQANGMHYRIRYAVARGEMTQAMEQAVQLSQKQPEFHLSWLTLAQIQQATGRYEEAIGNYSLALEKQPTNIDAMRGLIECAYALGRAEEAKRHLDRALRVAPNSPAFREMALQHELQYGDPMKVVAPREAALKSNPEQPRNWAQLALAYRGAARAKQVAGDEAGTRQMLEKARDTLAEARTKFPDERQFVISYAETCLMTDRFADAERAVQQWVARPEYQDKHDGTLLLANFYVTAGRVEQAEQTLRSAIASGGAKPELQIPLANLLFQTGQVDAALGALGENAEDPRVAQRKIEILIDSGRSGEAEQFVQAALAKQPDSVVLKLLDGMVKANTGKLDEAEKLFNEVLEKDGRNAVALRSRALVQLQRPRADLAAVARDLTAARDLEPNNLQLRMQLAEVQRRRGDTDAALREMESAQRLFPNDKQVRLKLFELYANSQPPRWLEAERLLREMRGLPQFANDPEVLHAEAAMHLQRNSFSQALEAIRAALKVAPDNLNLLRTLFTIQLNSKDYSTLVAESEPLVKANPQLWWVYQFRGTAKARARDKAGALTEFEAALNATNTARNDPAAEQVVRAMATELGVDEALRIAERLAAGDHRWKLTAAVLRQNKGDVSAAINWVEQVLQQPDLPANLHDTALRMAGGFYLLSDPPQSEKAVAAYRKLLERHPDDWGTLNNLAFILATPGPTFQPAEALQHSTKAYELLQKAGVSEPLVFDTHAWALFHNGRTEEAITLLRTVLEQRQFPEAHYHLGEALLKANQPDEAERSLTRAMELILELERDNKDVDETLKARVQDAQSRVKQAKSAR